MEDEKAIELLKAMGFSENEARNMIVGPAGRLYIQQLEAVEAAIRHNMNDQDVDTTELLRESGFDANSTSFENSRSRK